MNALLVEIAAVSLDFEPILGPVCLTWVCHYWQLSDYSKAVADKCDAQA